MTPGGLSPSFLARGKQHGRLSQPASHRLIRAASERRSSDAQVRRVSHKTGARTHPFPGTAPRRRMRRKVSAFR